MKENKHNFVFIISVVLTLAICLWGIVLPDSFGKAATGSMNFLTTDFGTARPYCL